MMTARREAVRRKAVTLAIVLLTSSVLFMQGCGSSQSTTTPSNDCQAPFGSKITFLKGAGTLTLTGMTALPADAVFDYTVLVQYPDGTPMPKACVTISGSLAEPANSGSVLWAYQFYYMPGGTGTTGNYKVYSPFTAQTNDFGQYTFSAVMPAGTTAFYDQAITAQSGANIATTTLQLITQ